MHKNIASQTTFLCNIDDVSIANPEKQGVSPNRYRICIQYTEFCQFQVFTQKVQNTLAPATVLSASAVDETGIEQVSNYCSKNSKLLVCLVQQFPLAPYSLCSLGLSITHLTQTLFSASEVVLSPCNGTHWFNMVQNGYHSWLPELFRELWF